MPVTITLATIPGLVERHGDHSAKTLELFGPSLDHETVRAATVDDIHRAVMAFGHRVRTAHPDASFQVSVSLRKGERKPRGFDKACRRNGFGQEVFLRVADKRTAPAVATASSAA